MKVLLLMGLGIYLQWVLNHWKNFCTACSLTSHAIQFSNLWVLIFFLISMSNCGMSDIVYKCCFLSKWPLFGYFSPPYPLQILMPRLSCFKTWKRPITTSQSQWQILENHLWLTTQNWNYKCVPARNPEWTAVRVMRFISAWLLSFFHSSVYFVSLFLKCKQWMLFICLFLHYKKPYQERS